jgi:hypothetical protein
MRLGTREAIHHVVKNLDASVRTSGAVSFTEDPSSDRLNAYLIRVYSYSMCIGRILWGFEQTPGKYSDGLKRRIIYFSLNREKRSITTSKHQTWLAGALAIHQREALELVEGKDSTMNKVALDRAQEHGWLKVDGATAKRIITSREQEVLDNEEANAD